METIYQIKQEIEARNLYGVMNETRWNSVYNIFKNTDLPFLYRSIDVFGNVFPEGHLRFDVRQVFPQYFASVMWLEIHSRENEIVGALIPPKIEDHTSLAIDSALKAGARFTLTDYGIKIWGYVEPGSPVEFYE